MSFLNPVNEPVLRFSSTDASAPQINYNDRVAGDVKAILKACLVKGYGDKASAGWSIVNEVDHVAEFVSPSAAMSDYRLGIDDTSTSSTTWYYQYQDARTSPANNSLTKSFNTINKTSARNGWQLLVTQRGIIFIEIVESSLVSELVARVTYWGKVKSALINDGGVNIALWTAGFASPSLVPYQFFDPTKDTYKHYKVGAYGTGLRFSAANISSMSRGNVAIDDKAAVELTATLYLHNAGYFAAEQPAILLKDNNSTNQYGVYDALTLDRNVLSVCLAWDINNLAAIAPTSKTILIHLDYWEY